MPRKVASFRDSSRSAFVFLGFKAAVSSSLPFAQISKRPILEIEDRQVKKSLTYLELSLINGFHPLALKLQKVCQNRKRFRPRSVPSENGPAILKAVSEPES